MTMSMKIVYTCLIIGGLAGCGDSKESGGAGAGGNADQAPVNSVKTQGQGELRIKNSDDEKSAVLKLKSGEKDGSVYCERKASGRAIISLGSFFTTTSGLKENVPLTGLTFTLDDAQEAGKKDLLDVVFNLEDSFPSSPQCLLNSEGIQNSILKASIQCMDNVERSTWGYVQIKADFSCEM